MGSLNKKIIAIDVYSSCWCSKAKMISILFMIFLMGVGCVAAQNGGALKPFYTAEELAAIPTLHIAQVESNRKRSYVMMTHSDYGIAATPKCWDSTLGLFEFENSEKLSPGNVVKCRDMSQNTMKIFILLIAKCQHIDIGVPLYVDEATEELCSKSLDDSNLLTCLGGLSKEGQISYLMYSTNIYTICHRLGIDVSYKYERDIQRDILTQYKELVKHSIHINKELDQYMQEHHRELQELSVISKRLVDEVENSMKELKNVDKKNTTEGIPLLENLMTNWKMMSDIIYWVMVNGEGLNPMRLFGIQWNFTAPAFEFGWNMFCSIDVADFFLLFAIFRWILGKIMTSFFPSTSFRYMLKWLFILQVFAEVVQYISARNQYVWQLRILSICGDFTIGFFFFFFKPVLDVILFVFETLKLLYRLFYEFYKFLYVLVFNKIRPTKHVKKSSPTKRVGMKKNKTLTKVSTTKPDYYSQSINFIADSSDDVSDIKHEDYSSDKSNKRHDDKKRSPVYRKR